MRLGALTVKEYAWYKTMFWGGGRVTFLNPDGVTSTTQCWDVKDTTADQIYKDVKLAPDGVTWIEANVPTPANLKAMRETWHFSMRKWMADKNKSRLFLTGYRSGKKKPCGTDSTGFKIFQKSLRDCGVKGMTFEETVRRYFQPNLEMVDVRGHDVLSDNSTWRGDLGVINGDGEWRLYKGAASGFSGGASGSFNGLGTLLGQGVGETTGASASANRTTPNWDDDRMYADLVMLVDDGGKKLKAARGTGSGFAAPTSQAAPSDAAQLLVGDFNGDRLADAGLLSTTSAGNAKLVVMRGQGNDTFGAAVDWWAGALDLSVANAFVAAADVNGDGKADLVMRDSDGGAYRVAPSVASCGSFANFGACTSPGGTGLGSSTAWLNSGTTLAETRNTVSDFDRDGRDDVLVVMANAGGVKVMALRARLEGGFADPAQLWSGAGSVADTVPYGMDVDPDGLGDVALIVKDGAGTDVTWLRSNSRTTLPATMTSTSVSDGTFSWAGVRPF